MIPRGGPPALATGAICAGGTLGILIPPSITLILYGIATETSIGRLFLSGVVPGILLVVLFSAWAWFATLVARRELIVVDEHFTLKEKMEGMVRVGPFLAIIAAIAYFKYGGLTTPSEIAALLAAIRDLPGFPLETRTKVSILGEMQETVSTVTAIRLGPQPPELFEVPPGFRLEKENP